MSVTLDSVKLKWPDGSPVMAGDLIAGQTYKFNAVTGVMVMAHKDVGEKEQRNRELAAQKRVEANKRLIDTAGPKAKVKVSSIGRMAKNTHVKKIGRRGR